MHTNEQTADLGKHSCPLVFIRGFLLFGPRLVALFLGLTRLALGAAEEKPAGPDSLPAPKHVVVPRLRERVKVDGELNEPAWAMAALLQPFYQNDGSGPEREHTQVRLWYDDQALYLGWTCQDRDIQATFTNRDSHFWEEEVVEFFVTPKELTRYFELEWNPLGGVFDATIENDLDAKGISEAFHGHWSYTAKGMTSAVKVKGQVNHPSEPDQSWQVEVRLPFADLGRSAPKAGEVWRANFYRFNRTTGLPVEQLSWSPTIWPGFHQPTRFGYLEFSQKTVQLPPAERPATWAMPVAKPGLPNLHKVSPALYRGAQPTRAGMSELQAMGIKTLVSLRGLHDDENLTAGTSLGYVGIPFHIWHPEEEDMLKFLKVVSDPARQPVFVHCKRGIDRTGTMVALYRIAIQGWSKEEAIREMTQGGFGYDDLFPNLISYLEKLDVEGLRQKAGIKPVTSAPGSSR